MTLGVNECITASAGGTLQYQNCHPSPRGIQQDMTRIIAIPGAHLAAVVAALPIDSTERAVRRRSPASQAQMTDVRLRAQVL